MLARALSTCVALALVVACSKPDNHTPEVDAAPEPAAPAVEPLGPSPIVDLRVWDSGKRVCVLHADGRVACGATNGTEIDPPLESLGSAVELTSSTRPVPQVCVRGEQGSVRCLDGAGEVHEVEGIWAARSLASSCAVTSEGGFWCWDESFVAEPAMIPNPIGELEHVALVYDGSPMAGGCALQIDGELWCWLDAMETLGIDLGEPAQRGGHSEADTYAPVHITDVGDGSQVVELTASDLGVCWRLPSGWTCARRDTSSPFPPPGIQNVVAPDEQCDTHPCNCSFPCWEPSCQFRATTRSKLSCEVPQPDGQFTVDSHHLSKVVRFSIGALGQCVVDVDSRVWCQTAEQAVHELVVGR